MWERGIGLCLCHLADSSLWLGSALLLPAGRASVTAFNFRSMTSFQTWSLLTHLGWPCDKVASLFSAQIWCGHRNPFSPVYELTMIRQFHITASFHFTCFDDIYCTTPISSDNGYFLSAVILQKIGKTIKRRVCLRKESMEEYSRGMGDTHNFSTKES